MEETQATQSQADAVVDAAAVQQELESSLPTVNPATGSFVEETPETAVAAEQLQARQPEYSQLHAPGNPGGTGTIGRFYEVDVTLWAELGRATLPLGQLVRLAEGSVIELGRPITEPVDLMAQGVRVARGEVVVVDDCFALRIKEIDSLPESR